MAKALLKAYMTVRLRIILIFGLTLAGLLLLAMASAWLILMRGYARLENEQATNNTQRVTAAIANDLENLEAPLADWAQWDDLYAYMQNRNPAFARGNLVDSTFTSLHIEVMVILDADGKPVYRNAFDLERKCRMPFPSGLAPVLAPKGNFLRLLKETKGPVGGVIIMPAAPLLIAARPITESTGKAIPRGTLIMARFLDDDWRDHIASITHVHFIVRPLPAPYLSRDFRAAANRLLAGETTVVRPLDRKTIAGYSLVNDPYGQPALILQMQNSRGIHAQGLASIRYLILCLLGSGLIFGALALVLTDKYLLSRLSRLHQTVSDIAVSSDFSSRLAIEGNDELSSLSSAVNEMLGALAIAHQMEMEKQAMLRVFHDIQIELSRQETVDDLCRRAIELGRSQLGFDRLSIWRISEEPNIIIGTYGVDEDGHIRDERACRLDVTQDTVIGRVFHSDTPVVLMDKTNLLDNRATTVGVGSLATAVLRDSGKVVAYLAVDNLLTGRPITSQDCEFIGLYATAIGHLYSQKRASEALRASEDQYRTLFSTMSEGFGLHEIICDDQGRPVDYRFLDVNPAFEQLTGLVRGDIIGRTVREVLPDVEQDWIDRYGQVALTGNPISFSNYSQPLDRHYEVMAFRPRPGHFAVLFFDTTARKRIEDRLNFLAHNDDLTSLPNRFLFIDRLNTELSHALRHGRHIAVMFLDLDRFKEVNDSLGHDIGDQLLRAVAKRLSDCVRESDTVARMSGDEFVFILPDIASTASVEATAQRILRTLTDPFMIREHELYISASIGVTLAPSDGGSVDSLMRNADVAMYRAKERGGDTYQFFSPEMGAAITERHALEQRLRKAIELDEFELYYQPQVDFTTGRIYAIESLVRWQHPELGLVAPLDFIPLSEETGQIELIGYWVLQTACRQMQQWREAGLGELRVAVNLSARQFERQNIVENVKRVLEETGLPPHLLELEITERIAMRDSEYTITTLHQLRELGVRIALDDFGIGHCSFGYLKRFPVDTLKIDRAFVQDILDDQNNAEIVRAIIVLGQALGLTVIAECVETEGQAAMLFTHGCKYFQGYYFCPPLPANECQSLLASASGLPVSIWGTIGTVE